MFSQLANIWRVHDLRNKLLFVVVMVAVYRLGVFIRVPGVDPMQDSWFAWIMKTSFLKPAYMAVLKGRA